MCIIVFTTRNKRGRNEHEHADDNRWHNLRNNSWLICFDEYDITVIDVCIILLACSSLLLRRIYYVVCIRIRIRIYIIIIIIVISLKINFLHTFCIGLTCLIWFMHNIALWGMSSIIITTCIYLDKGNHQARENKVKYD